jgi:hypothetical protein
VASEGQSEEEIEALAAFGLAPPGPCRRGRSAANAASMCDFLSQSSRRGYDVQGKRAARGSGQVDNEQAVVDPRDDLIRMPGVHTLRLRDGVGGHLMRTWPTTR